MHFLSATFSFSFSLRETPTTRPPIRSSTQRVSHNGRSSAENVRVFQIVNVVRWRVRNGRAKRPRQTAEWLFHISPTLPRRNPACKVHTCTNCKLFFITPTPPDNYYCFLFAIGQRTTAIWHSNLLPYIFDVKKDQQFKQFFICRMEIYKKCKIVLCLKYFVLPRRPLELTASTERVNASTKRVNRPRGSSADLTTSRID